MREQRKTKYPDGHVRVDVQLTGRRNKKCAKNSMKFMAHVEGVEYDGHLRGANGIRWRLA